MKPSTQGASSGWRSYESTPVAGWLAEAQRKGVVRRPSRQPNSEPSPPSFAPLLLRCTSGPSPRFLEPVRKRPQFAKLLGRAEEQHQLAEREFARLGGDRILGLGLGRARRE